MDCRLSVEPVKHNASRACGVTAGFGVLRHYFSDREPLRPCVYKKGRAQINFTPRFNLHCLNLVISCVYYRAVDRAYA